MEYIKRVGKIKNKKVRGSTVIEMAYIMPIFLGMFLLIMNAVFYYHDKAVINGAAGETAILGVQAERRKNTQYDPEKFFMERIKGKLICMTDTDVDILKENDGITVTASAQKAFMKIEVSQKALIVKPEEKIRRMR